MALGRNLTASALLLAALSGAPAGEPCVPGLSPGQRPGPYAAVVAVGTQRGQSHCYVCETGDRPAVIVFARRPGDRLGKLVRGLDPAVAEHQAADRRGWVTSLRDAQRARDPQVGEWGRQQATRRAPLAASEDPGGPPSYRLHRDADVAVLLAAKQKVV